METNILTVRYDVSYRAVFARVVISRVRSPELGAGPARRAVFARVTISTIRSPESGAGPARRANFFENLKIRC